LQIFNSKAEEVLSSSNIWSFIPSIVHPFLKFHHQHLPLSLPLPKDHQEHQQKIGSSIVLKLLSQHTPQILTMPLTCIKQTFTNKNKKEEKSINYPLPCCLLLLVAWFIFHPLDIHFGKDHIPPHFILHQFCDFIKTMVVNTKNH
jgi:hypothetical protein